MYLSDALLHRRVTVVEDGIRLGDALNILPVALLTSLDIAPTEKENEKEARRNA